MEKHNFHLPSFLLLPLGTYGVLISENVQRITSENKQNILCTERDYQLEMWANAQPDGRPAEYR